MNWPFVLTTAGSTRSLEKALRIIKAFRQNSIVLMVTGMPRWPSKHMMMCLDQRRHRLSRMMRLKSSIRIPVWPEASYLRRSLMQMSVMWPLLIRITLIHRQVPATTILRTMRRSWHRSTQFRSLWQMMWRSMWGIVLMMRRLSPSQRHRIRRMEIWAIRSSCWKTQWIRRQKAFIPWLIRSVTAPEQRA